MSSHVEVKMKWKGATDLKVSDEALGVIIESLEIYADTYSGKKSEVAFEIIKEIEVK